MLRILINMRMLVGLWKSESSPCGRDIDSERDGVLTGQGCSRWAQEG
jgi:hypothetical protein